MTAKDFKVGHVISITLNDNKIFYFRVLKTNNDLNSIYIKQCLMNDSYDFVAGQPLLKLSLSEFKNDEIKIITWYTAGIFDSLLGGFV